MHLDEQVLREYLTPLLRDPTHIKYVLNHINTQVTEYLNDEIFFYWSENDVYEINPFYSKEEALTVLKEIAWSHSSIYDRGMTWHILEESLKGHRLPQAFLVSLKEIIRSSFGVKLSTNEIYEYLKDQSEDYIKEKEGNFVHMVWKYQKNELEEKAVALFKNKLMELFHLNPIEVIKQDV